MRLTWEEEYPPYFEFIDTSTDELTEVGLYLPEVTSVNHTRYSTWVSRKYMSVEDVAKAIDARAMVVRFRGLSGKHGDMPYVQTAGFDPDG